MPDYINFCLRALSTSSGVGTIPPKRPKCSTLTFPLTAKRISSTICPAFNSTEIIPFTLFAYSAMIFDGKGHNVIGRNTPTFMPSARAISCVFRQIRAIEPNAIIK